MNMFGTCHGQSFRTDRRWNADGAVWTRLPRARGRASSHATMGAMVFGARSTSFPRRAAARIYAVLASFWLMQTWLIQAQPGALDTDFNPGDGVDQSVFAVSVQTDGKIVIGGDFT